MAEVIFGDAGKAKHWLFKPKSRFSGKSPTAMLSTTHGTHLVKEILIQVAGGMSF
ncbi:MbcA/ParS/Xre antitoxin family protein [Pseudomonas sp. Ant30-3]|uniref:MbcA/ParS/Xre antitoxin family protein n=1 Tax=Pseudomonas sp. Ant30-3 TaxID=1488328 RepID=UPI0009DCFF95|nr:MbcA/ParS/Xre antitoxin family protein [Pseudomonas sp. Ant30-3]